VERWIIAARRAAISPSGGARLAASKAENFSIHFLARPFLFARLFGDSTNFFGERQSFIE